MSKLRHCDGPECSRTSHIGSEYGWLGVQSLSALGREFGSLADSEFCTIECLHRWAQKAAERKRKMSESLVGKDSHNEP